MTKFSSTLGLIILSDQFSRNIYRNSRQAFDQDQKVLDLCLTGIEKQYDHLLSLIERVFFYFPLMHSEILTCNRFLCARIKC